jgi:outer membrane lipoprotein-sorting protein
VRYLAQGSRDKYGRTAVRPYFIIKRAAFASYACIILVIHGCALKPSPGIPVDITAHQVLAAVNKQSALIQDFSTAAFMEARLKGESSQTANVSIRYVKNDFDKFNPDRFRIILKGFAGIAGAVITTSGDSMSVFYPSDNTFIRIGRDQQFSMPGIDLDFDRIASFVTGAMLPPPEEWDTYRISLESRDVRPVLTMEKDTSLHRFILEGAELRVIGEEFVCDGVIVWTKKASRFRSVNGVMFPGKISIENSRGSINMEFSRCKINSGLTDSDLSFIIPSSAQRIFY